MGERWGQIVNFFGKKEQPGQLNKEAKPQQQELSQESTEKEVEGFSENVEFLKRDRETREMCFSTPVGEIRIGAASVEGEIGEEPSEVGIDIPKVGIVEIPGRGQAKEYIERILAAHGYYDKYFEDKASLSKKVLVGVYDPREKRFLRGITGERPKNIKTGLDEIEFWESLKK